MLEFMKTKELNLLLGCCLARNPDGLEASSADAEMLVRSWRVLIPLKMEVGFDNAISSLEQVCWKAEQIKLNHMGNTSVAGHDVHLSPVVHFYSS
jgi:hypothetical protein